MPAVKPPAAAKGPLGVLKKKVGPAPLWVWFAVGLLLFVVYRRFSGAANNTGATPVTPQTSPGTTMDGSGGTSGGGGQASGSGMGADPNQLLDAYRSGGSDYASIFGSLLPYFYSGQGSTAPAASNDGGSSGGAAVQGAQNPTRYIAAQTYEGIAIPRQPYTGDILLSHPSPQAQKYGSPGTLQYGISGGGGSQPKFAAPAGSSGIFLFK